MIIYFGLGLDKLVHPIFLQKEEDLVEGIEYCGPYNLLGLLETQMGITSNPEDVEFIRIEQYRQQLARYVNNYPDVFYAASFLADEFATASFLLNRRDELVLSGWEFETSEESPTRLKVLATIEQFLKNAAPSFEEGYADRLKYVIGMLDGYELPFEKVVLNEPLNILPFHFQHLFQLLQEKGIDLETIITPTIQGNSDLDLLKKALSDRKQRLTKNTLNGDGSLVIINAKRETDAAAFLAKVLALNETFNPLCVIPEQNRALDNALIMEGQPSMGILSASLARPSLQILKLVSAFLWKPIDSMKIMEFLTLAIKPLNHELANLIAREISRSPGLNSKQWDRTIYGFFQDLEQLAKDDSSINIKKIRREYNLWFKRTRYDIGGTVPKNEVIEIFSYLTIWAKKQFDEKGKKHPSLIVLSSQAKKIRDLLELLPVTKTQLTALELERIVRTIYEPAPVQFSETQVGSLPHIHEPSAIVAPTTSILWWNFHDSDQEHHFSKWTKKEMEYLRKQDIHLETPELENQRMLWQRQRPFLMATKQLILVILEKVNGIEVLPHPLYGDMQAIFDDLSTITYNIHSGIRKEIMKDFQLPQLVELTARKGNPVRPYLHIKQTERLTAREKESFSSLDDLFYYPYKWVFKNKIKLRSSPILSVVRERTMLGNLAHRMFEMLFKAPELSDWGKPEIHHFIDTNIQSLLETEGSTLLMYGREPDRVNFQNKLKYACYYLVKCIRNNNWEIKSTEQPFNGSFLDVTINGITDLILVRGNEYCIIDLKWAGATRRKNMIKSQEDLQLVLYSKLLNNDDQWAHTAYYIIETGQLIARNNIAFQEALAVSPDEDHEAINQAIWDRMNATYQWRVDQIKEGTIEIRTEKTAEMLEEEEDQHSRKDQILEMKDKDAPFNDYEMLIS